MTYLLALDSNEFGLMRVNSEDFCTHLTDWVSSAPDLHTMTPHDFSYDETLSDWTYDNDITHWRFDTLQAYTDFIQSNPELFI